MLFRSGICSNLKKEDKVFTAHRSHAHYLAKGGSLKKMIAELYGKLSEKLREMDWQPKVVTFGIPGECSELIAKNAQDYSGGPDSATQGTYGESRDLCEVYLLPQGDSFVIAQATWMKYRR